ncbi:MAG: hypothetical protein E8D41_04025 [Nitrospira sp.]|nr:MAG: hypothetical protein E8D41_04025 [Nitrospira sp.]
MRFEVLAGRQYVEKLAQQGAALMEDTNIFKDPDWVLGDMAWVVLGGTVVFGLLLLNAYVQKIARSEEHQRIERLSAENLKRERLAAAQSRRPDNI